MGILIGYLPLVVVRLEVADRTEAV